MEIADFIVIPEWTLLLAGVLTLAFIYYVRTYSYWSKKGVRQLPKPLLIVGNSYDMFLKPFHEVERKRYENMGRIYGFYEGGRPLIAIAEPEQVRKILVKDFNIFPRRRLVKGIEPLFDNFLSVIDGERWKSMRSVVSQTFSSGKMRKLSPLISECVDSLIENISDAADKDKPIDCRMLFGAFSMDVIASCAFGTKIDSHKDPKNPFVRHAKKIFSRELSIRFMLAFIAPRIYKMLRLKFLEKEVREFFCDISHRLINERKAKKQKRNDFLQLILDASELSSKGVVDIEEEQSGNNLENIYEVEKGSSDIKVEVSSLKDKALTETEVLAQCLLFFAAGYETTTTTLAFCLYHMALNPETQEKLIQEVDRTFEEHGQFDYDIVAQMPYLNALVTEVLRLNNPASRLERVAEEDYTLDNGVLLPKGSIVTIPAYAMHHDPEWFPEPDKFNPERFLPENRDKIVPYTYLPFGAGPRNCVALRFALMETKLCLAKIMRNMKFSRCADTRVPPDFLAGSQLLQPQGIILKPAKRTR